MQPTNKPNSDQQPAASKPKSHTFSLNDILAQPSSLNNSQQQQQLLLQQQQQQQQSKKQPLSVMELLNDKSPVQCVQTTRASPISPATVAIRRPRTPQQPTTKPQAALPLRTLVAGNDNESWYLRCFCDIKSELGLMIQCEKCFNWQHAACLNITQTTLPNNYTCPICANKFIRCRCQENMNYRLPLIKCSKCGYYVHKKCEGLDNGPYFSNNHICTQCGGTPCQPPDVKLPIDTPFKNNVISLDQQLLDELHPSILTAPFAPVLTEEFMDHDLSAFQFCEVVYNKYRNFFYLTHPTITFYQPKKRRSDVSFSFFRAVFYILDKVFNMSQDAAVQIFNALSAVDIYMPFSMPQTVLQSNTNPIEFTDLAKADFEKTKHTPELTQVSFPKDLVLIRGSLCCQSALQPEQLIGVASGLIGLIDEFCYDNGADAHYYQFTTKFVLDSRKSGAQLIHNFKRSLSSNCVLKLFKFNGMVYAGIFAGVSDVNGIARRTRREKFPIQAESELTLPIDFAPATIEDPVDFMGWHLDEIDVSLTSEQQNSPPIRENPSSSSFMSNSTSSSQRYASSGSQRSNNSLSISSPPPPLSQQQQSPLSSSSSFLTSSSTALSSSTTLASSTTLTSSTLSSSAMNAAAAAKHARPSREERDGAAAMRQLERKKKRLKKEEKENRNKNRRKANESGKRSGRVNNKHSALEAADSSLFAMMKQTTPEQFLFELQPNEEEENETEVEEIVLNERDIFNGEIDCAFLDEMLEAEIRPFNAIKMEDPIKDLIQHINLDDLE